MGIENPKPSDFKKIEAIPDGQLLKAILKTTTASPAILAARYGLSKRMVECTKTRSK